MNAKELHRQQVSHELEHNIRDHCLLRVVKNNGIELKQLLKDECLATDVEHIGNFVFSVETRQVKQLLIFTEPVGGREEYIQITGYSISPKKRGENIWNRLFFNKS